MWNKYVTRRLAVQVAQQWNFGFGEIMKKNLGISVDKVLVFRDENKTEYYLDKKQQHIYTKGLYQLLNDKKFLREFHDKAQRKLELIYSEVKNDLKMDFSSVTDKELIDIFKNTIQPNTAEFYIYMWTVFNIGEPLSNVVIGLLGKRIPDQNQLTEYLLSFSSPLEPNDILQERKDILKLAIKRKTLSKSEFNRKLNSHVAKYQHIPMFDFDHKPYDKSHFLNEIKSLKNPDKELREINKLFSGRKVDFRKKLLQLTPNAELKAMLIFLKENVFLRDHRDMIRQKLNLELRKYYHEVSSRLGLTIKQVATLTNEEIEECLKSKKKFSKYEAQRREKSYLLIQKNNKVLIYSGADAIKIAEQELKSNETDKSTKIKGVAGSIGIAKGIVKIVHTNKDLPKVKRGDVLVTTMTRQDFVPAMRKAVAIVTDEGSMTCHAAIIARELKIPCIVATKYATEVLKDGEKVIVNVTSKEISLKICG